jgi:hypothetical protein
MASEPPSGGRQEAGLNDSREVFAAAREGLAAARTIVDAALEAARPRRGRSATPPAAVPGSWRRHVDQHFEQFAGAMDRRLDPATQFTRTSARIVRAQLGNRLALWARRRWRSGQRAAHDLQGRAALAAASPRRRVSITVARSADGRVPGSRSGSTQSPRAKLARGRGTPPRRQRPRTWLADGGVCAGSSLSSRPGGSTVRSPQSGVSPSWHHGRARRPKDGSTSTRLRTIGHCRSQVSKVRTDTSRPKPCLRPRVRIYSAWAPA